MTQRRVLTESEFLAETESRDYRDSLKNILDESLGLGLVIQWWSVGGSIRVATPFHTDPITVAWVFPPDRGWMGMRDFNIGFDSWTAKTVPDSKTLLESYAKRVSALAGAEPVNGKRWGVATPLVYTPVRLAAQRV